MLKFKSDWKIQNIQLQYNAKKLYFIYQLKALIMRSDEFCFSDVIWIRKVIDGSTKKASSVIFFAESLQFLILT